MGVYARHVFPRLYGRMIAVSERSGLGARRSQLLAAASGRVLELGAGTGVSLDHYPREVEELILTEPESGMFGQLERRVAATQRSTQVVAATAERLPFEGESFDYVVSALVLCTVVDQAAALSEAKRVLKPGGELLFLEHVRSGDPKLARWQDGLNWLQRRVGCGCNCNRDTLSAVERAGFELGEVQRGSLPRAYPLIEPMIWGSARA